VEAESIRATPTPSTAGRRGRKSALPKEEVEQSAEEDVEEDATPVSVFSTPVLS
jgi:hypothetical protein